MDTRAVKDKQNLDPVPEDQLEEASSPYKRKLKLINAGDLRKKRVSCMSGDLRQRSGEQKTTPDALSVTNYEREHVLSANHNRSDNMSDRDTDGAQNEFKGHRTHPEKDMLP